MPARGCTNLDDYSDFEIARTVVYMADHGGANFPEPAQPKPGEVAGASAPAAAAAGGADSAQAGKALYTQVCQACHAACSAYRSSATRKPGRRVSRARWTPSIIIMYNYALHGKGAMPPKGGSNASDADVKAAVDYMVGAAK